MEEVKPLLFYNMLQKTKAVQILKDYAPVHLNFYAQPEEIALLKNTKQQETQKLVLRSAQLLLKKLEYLGYDTSKVKEINNLVGISAENVEKFMQKAIEELKKGNILTEDGKMNPKIEAAKTKDSVGMTMTY